MPCNQNCRQGRACDCVPDVEHHEPTSLPSWAQAIRMVLVTGTSIAAAAGVFGFVAGIAWKWATQ